MHDDESWTPLPTKVKPARFHEIVSVRGPLLTFRRKNTLWVLRAGTDPRAWLMKLDEAGRGTGKWLHGRPWLDDLLRPPEIILRTQEAALKKLLNDLKLVRRWARQRDAAGASAGEMGPMLERLNPATLPHLVRHWTKLHEALPQWEQISLTRPRHARLAYARMRRAEHLLRRSQEVADWLGHFPAEALAYLERHGFHDGRWRLLNLWLRVPDGRELFEELPAVAAMLSRPQEYRITRDLTHPFRSVRAVVRKPRNRILEWLNLPPGAGTLKLLRMLPGSACRLISLVGYHAVLHNATMRGWLLNLGVPLTHDILRAAIPGYITYPMLHAIAHRQRMATFGAREWVSRVHRDVRMLLWSMETDVDQTQLGRIRSTARLWEYHEELVRQSNQLQRDHHSSWQGSLAPPAPPAAWMQPLDTVAALDAEAREQRHCLTGYHHEVAAGHYYAYAVHHEQGRATLGLSRRATGGWRIDQLRGAANRSVSPDVHAAVAEWAQQHRIQVNAWTVEADEADEIAPAHRQLELVFDGEDDIPF
jgi:hypothetical protein